jgi:hypothetical protein
MMPVFLKIALLVIAFVIQGTVKFPPLAVRETAHVVKRADDRALAAHVVVRGKVAKFVSGVRHGFACQRLRDRRRL